MIRLVVMDLDGTLLDSNKKLSERNRRTIERLKQENVHVCIATGRSYHDAAARLKDLELDLPLVTCNGALIRELNTGKIINKLPLGPAIARDVISFIERQGHKAYCFSIDTWYAKWIDEWTRRDYEESGFLPEIVTDFTPYLENVMRISVCGTHKELEELKQRVEDQFKGYVKALFSLPNWIDFLHPRASKASGVAVIQKILRVAPEETMAIGDYYNDIELFTKAGFAVAMKNAPEEVRDIADYVTASNDEDGVSKVIEELIFKDANKGPAGV